LYKLGLIDAIIPEPLGGAHRNVHDTVYNVQKYITRMLAALKRTKTENLLENRYKKLRSIGSSPADIIRLRTQASRERVKEALKAIPSKAKEAVSQKSRRQPAKV